MWEETEIRQRDFFFKGGRGEGGLRNGKVTFYPNTSKLVVQNMSADWILSSLA